MVKIDVSPPLLTVFYNTKCPVCDAGIGWQKRRLINAMKQGKIAFEDINQQPEALKAYGATLEDIRRRLHAVDDSGALLIGADVAIAIWRLTPGDGWLAAMFGNAVMRPVSRFAYNRFADVLYAWNRHKRHW